MDFARPELLYFLLIIPLMIAWYIYKYSRNHPSIQVSTTEPFIDKSRSWRLWLVHLLFVLRVLAIALIIVALARPQSSLRREDITVEGIDIVITFDVSGSMLAEDFKPNRIEAAKDLAIQFIHNRPNDRIGLVVFAGESYTQCPLTTDHPVLTNLFREVRQGIIQDGTAIGDGLAIAVDRLRNSKAVSKVVILLTDGVNNMGAVDPLTAAEMARLYGIRVYSIGVGTIGRAPFPVQTPFGKQVQMVDVKIDEEMLKEISNMTDGKYFRATSNEKLEEVYNEIDLLEKTKIDVTEYKRRIDEFRPLALLALWLLLTELVLRYTLFRSTP
ncbi:MAG TPA: VWA domain-containing protein [Bacteroidales bacterium]|nr:VWA domain-containing protein [Bacteroidales bacterium]